MKAWTMGLKTTYYLRNKGASQITKTISNAASIADTKNIRNRTKVSEETTEIKACLISDPTCEACQ